MPLLKSYSMFHQHPSCIPKVKLIKRLDYTKIKVLPMLKDIKKVNHVPFSSICTPNSFSISIKFNGLCAQVTCYLELQ